MIDHFRYFMAFISGTIFYIIIYEIIPKSYQAYRRHKRKKAFKSSEIVEMQRNIVRLSERVDYFRNKTERLEHSLTELQTSVSGLETVNDLLETKIDNEVKERVASENKGTGEK